MKKVAVIGGGLAGLIASIQLSRAKIPVRLFEKKRYPFHRVCGEYISNETVPFLKSLGLYPDELHPATISRFQLTAVNGRSAHLPLDLGGFGISRYAFDHWLFQKAIEAGVEVYQESEIHHVEFVDNGFRLSTHKEAYTSDIAIGAFGKRSRMDMKLNRSFIKKKSPFIGVKYHVKTDHPKELIALHNFKDGYCGISNIENGISNLCYLSHRNNLKQYGSIAAMEETILFKNPFLRNLFQNSDFLFEQPEVINEISFETKEPVTDHVLMCGDAAGMITPLCGNGMAMAIHSSKILSDLLIDFCMAKNPSREQLEKAYTQSWKNQFATRLLIGRQFQKLFGGNFTSNVAVGLMDKVKPLAGFLVSQSHGKEF